MNVIKKSAYVLCGLIATAAFGLACANTSMHVTVLDEAGSPMEGVTVRMGYLRPGENPAQELHVAKSDKEGKASSKGYTQLSAGVRALMEGYYESQDGCRQGEDANITLRLRKKETPVPMWGKREKCDIPEMDKWLGYDVMKGQWLPPHGEGEVADMEWKVSIVDPEPIVDGRLSWKICDFKLRFPNKGDGILKVSDGTGYIRESKKKLPNFAPEQGYQSTYEWLNVGKDQGQKTYSSFKEEYKAGYFFRIRTRFDEKGKLTGGYYGSVTSQFYLKADAVYRGKNSPARIFIPYAYNPNNLDRNMTPDDGNLNQGEGGGDNLMGYDGIH